jgi:hypothetical protein
MRVSLSCQNLPLGDGVDRAASELQEPPTMTLQEAIEVTRVSYGDVERQGVSAWS